VMLMCELNILMMCLLFGPEKPTGVTVDDDDVVSNI
jgi:hypothetical protein